MAKSMKSRLEEYKKEYSRWLSELDKYHTKFDENYKKYTGYNEVIGTESKIADPVASELVERVIQKLFERDPKFFVDTRGKNVPKEVKDIMGALIEAAWTNKDTVQSTGSMKSKLKVAGREFLIVGNTAVEAFWNYESDMPDFRVVPIEDIIFDPTKNIKTSKVYYIRQFVSLDYLKDNVEIKKDGEVVTGIFDSAAIKKLERLYPNKTLRKDPTSIKVKRYNTDEDINVDQIELITRWEGAKCCRFVMGDDEEKPLLLQEFENTVLGSNPISVAIDKEVVKEPYGISIIDDLSGMLKAKNLFLNQEVGWRAKALNPPTLIDPSVATNPISMKSMSNMYKLGGIVIAAPNMVEQKAMAQLGNTGLDILNWIEGRAESISGIGAYLAGVPNQVSDKTSGTKGGIEALIQQSTSPVADRQVNLEESIIEPLANKWLKMIGATMGKDEFKWVMLTGEEPRLVKLTKGFITGKIKLIDLMQADVVEDEEVQAIVDVMIAEGKDPEEDLVFDVDWLVNVETGSLAERDSAKEVENKQKVVEMGVALGLPVDTEKMWKEIAMDSGIKEPSNYLRKEEYGGQGIAGGVGAPIQPNQVAQPAPGVPGMAQAPGGVGAI